MDPAVGARILTLVFTDLADSTALKLARGDHAVADLIARHRAHVRTLADDGGGRVVDWAGDGCFLTFATPSAAVQFALRLQQAHADDPELPGVRTGVHMGEVSDRVGPGGGVEGLAVDLAARIAGLAHPGQILMSAAVADSARSRLERTATGRPIRWHTHGSYRLKGFDDPVEIREAGLEGVARFAPPAATEKAVPGRGTERGGRRRRLVAAGVLATAAVAAGAVFFSSGLRLRRPDTPASRAASASGQDTLAVPLFAGRPAIAVLPLDNLSPDPTQAFFADGLAEDLITRLSAWRSFPVIARTSSFRYRGADRDPKAIGAELGARYVVEGSVRRDGDHIRIAAQLIDAPSGEHVWAETYDRQVKDVFALQDEISATIAASIAGDMTRVEAERARRRGTDNLEAWGLYQMGLERSYRYTAADNAEARRLLQSALDADHGFAAALAALSMTHTWDVDFMWTDAPDHSITLGMEAARRAIDLDPREALAHEALAQAYLAQGDAQNGLDAARHAIDLNPSIPGAWIELGWALLVSGDTDGCITANKNAQRLDPKGELAAVAWDNIALAYWEQGQLDESLDAARHLLAARPDYIWGHLYLALNAVSRGHPDEARAAVAEARRLQPDLTIAKIQRAFGAPRPEADARRNAALRQAGLE